MARGGLPALFVVVARLLMGPDYSQPINYVDAKTLLASVEGATPEQLASVGVGPDGRRHCTAKSKATGKPCKMAPVPGLTVCSFHGGAGEGAREAAQRRLLALVEPALETLFKALGLHCDYYFLDDPNATVPLTASGKPADPGFRVVICREHGRECPEWPVRVNAAKALMDRAGFGPKQTVAVEDNRKDLSTVPVEELATELDMLALRAREEVTKRKNGNSASPTSMDGELH